MPSIDISGPKIGGGLDIHGPRIGGPAISMDIFIHGIMQRIKS